MKLRDGQFDLNGFGGLNHHLSYTIAQRIMEAAS